MCCVYKGYDVCECVCVIIPMIYHSGIFSRGVIFAVKNPILGCKGLVMVGVVSTIYIYVCVCARTILEWPPLPGILVSQYLTPQRYSI